MPFWHRIVIAAVVFVLVTGIARLVDWWLARKTVPPEVETRYRVLRRAITVTIITVGLFSALLVIPQVRAVAGALLASSAILGVILGLAADARKLHRRPPHCDEPARPDRRPGQLRGRGRDHRGDRPHLHVHPHRRPPPARRPEQQARLGHHRQRLDPQPRNVRRGLRAGPAFRRRRRCGRCAA
jgi:hypothetical protein